MRLAINHVTRYKYSQPVAHGWQRLRLRPKTTHGQEILDWDMNIEGATTQVEYDDQHNNATALVALIPGTQEIAISCQGMIDTSDQAGVIGRHTGHMPLWCFLRATPLTRAGLKVRALVSNVDHDKEDRLGFLHALSEAIRNEVEYTIGVTDIDTTAEQALTLGKGVCQDHAHVFLSAGRLLDIPMRYVGGYLMMNDRVEQDAGHGWAEAYIDGLGWVGFDISNGISPDERYVRVATGCDYSEAAPVTGIAAQAGDVELEVKVAVAQGSNIQSQSQSSGGQSQSQSQGQASEGDPEDGLRSGGSGPPVQLTGGMEPPETAEAKAKGGKSKKSGKDRRSADQDQQQQQ